MKNAEEIVNVFAKSFVIGSRRDRMLSLFVSKRVRTKVCNRLAHQFIDDLEPKYVFEAANCSEDIRKRESELLKDFYINQSEGKCYVISEQEELDNKFLTIDEIHWERHDDMGTIVIVIPGHLAYYYGEDVNADYVLIR